MSWRGKSLPKLDGVTAKRSCGTSSSSTTSTPSAPPPQTDSLPPPPSTAPCWSRYGVGTGPGSSSSSGNQGANPCEGNRESIRDRESAVAVAGQEREVRRRKHGPRRLQMLVRPIGLMKIFES
ncbi:hypothetical protein PVAP13_7NG186272 [Panicum virgatum]|uniref:Uncharacterized protein n=1 Tax=Panicum virgatum TaxID=38727 RepID=A0A8T0Q454_PANVG|nr:hypothetical protein PVAP13_7NG186272 [Panicum virgatum]